jgi:hypothetical protein
MNIFGSREERLIKKVIKTYFSLRKEEFPHDIVIDKIQERFFPDITKCSDVGARYMSISIMVSVIGNFEKTCYGMLLEEAHPESPVGSLRDKMRYKIKNEKITEMEIIVDNLKEANFFERDLKLLTFAIYDFKFPDYITPELCKKRIKQINDVYGLIKEQYDILMG